jgi:hypothetical protein
LQIIPVAHHGKADRRTWNPHPADDHRILRDAAKAIFLIVPDHPIGTIRFTKSGWIERGWKSEFEHAIITLMALLTNKTPIQSESRPINVNLNTMI